ncbi:NAD(P)-dependent oxidoreductase [Ruegeria hyattellae]|uniref:NAD(P)-dependent oxidoreductase n=1 Tax=Ruegeria hyattellae TaxID=3233337 RepID=UPI00355B4CBE
MRLGIIGTGNMGGGMLHRARDVGHQVLGYARSEKSKESLSSTGARVYDSVSALVDESDSVVTCLPNADVVETVSRALLPALRSGQVWVDATSSRPETSKRLHAQCREKGVVFADASLIGGAAQARSGKLVSVVGCLADELLRVSNVTDIYSKATIRMGDAGAGNTAKILNNFVSQGTSALVIQAFAMARRAGLDQKNLLEAFGNGAAQSAILEKMVPPTLRGEYHHGGFSIANARKDLKYAEELSLALTGHGSPTACAAAAFLDTAIQNGMGEAFTSTLLNPEIYDALAE